jgi:hypothetical protein
VPQDPAGVLPDALDQANLDARVVEGLPWLALTYVDMDWDWLVRNAKLRDRQNRLGFAVSLASEVAARNNDADLGQKLRHRLAILENARLAREGTFCHDKAAYDRHDEFVLEVGVDRAFNNMGDGPGLRPITRVRGFPTIETAAVRH